MQCHTPQMQCKLSSNAALAHKENLGYTQSKQPQCCQQDFHLNQQYWWKFAKLMGYPDVIECERQLQLFCHHGPSRPPGPECLRVTEDAYGAFPSLLLLIIGSDLDGLYLCCLRWLFWSVSCWMAVYRGLNRVFRAVCSALMVGSLLRASARESLNFMPMVV